MKRLYNTREMVKEGLPVMAISMVIGVAAGLVLNKGQTVLVGLPGLLILLPALMDMGGSLVAVLTSRLDSALQLHLIRPRLKHNKMLNMDEEAVIISAVVGFFTLALLAGGFSMLVGVATLQLPALVMMVVGVGVASLLIVSGLAIAVSFFAYQHGWDPDEVAIPLMTSLEDLVGIVFVLLFVGWVV